jgi:hypothetical protein
MFVMGSTAILDKEMEDLFGKQGGRASKAEEGVNVGSLVGSRRGDGTKADVKKETEGPSNSRDAADDVCAIDRAAVPGIGGGVSCFDKDGIGAMVIGGNGNSFIQKLMGVFNTDSFVVAFGSNVEGDVKEKADGFEKTFESAAVVNNDNAAETNFEEDILDKEASEIMGSDVVSGGDEHKTS